MGMKETDCDRTAGRRKERQIIKKKTYTKYDYCRIQTEVGAITSVFSLAALSLALLLGGQWLRASAATARMVA